MSNNITHTQIQNQRCICKLATYYRVFYALQSEKEKLQYTLDDLKLNEEKPEKKKILYPEMDR